METSINNKCKAFTSLEQSKKLAEILPLESADMFYDRGGLPSLIDKYVTHESIKNDKYKHLIPCWSLAALFNILPDGTNIIKDEADTENEKYMCTVGIKDDIISTFGNNPVDACVAMIERLHELNLL